jgi:HSP20 family protein
MRFSTRLLSPEFFRDPFREMERIRREMDRLFDGYLGEGADLALGGYGTGFPEVRMVAGDDEVRILAEVPGVASEDLEISVHGQTLTLKGKRPGPEAGDGVHLHRRERLAGEFVRSLQLPFRVDSEKVEASLKNGILTLRLPRPAEDQPRRIAVRSA